MPFRAHEVLSHLGAKVFFTFVAVIVLSEDRYNQASLPSNPPSPAVLGLVSPRSRLDESPSAQIGP
jgi:hypothetical protein